MLFEEVFPEVLRKEIVLNILIFQATNSETGRKQYSMFFLLSIQMSIC